MQRRRGSRADPVSEDDILRAIAKLGVLGGGFAVVKVGERRLVCRKAYCVVHLPALLRHWSSRAAVIPRRLQFLLHVQVLQTTSQVPLHPFLPNVFTKLTANQVLQHDVVWRPQASAAQSDMLPPWLQVRSVPGELSTDTNAVLRLAQASGHVAKPQLIRVSAALLWAL